jgi:hypothetical protein
VPGGSSAIIAPAFSQKTAPLRHCSAQAPLFALIRKCQALSSPAQRFHFQPLLVPVLQVSLSLFTTFTHQQESSCSRALFPQQQRQVQPRQVRGPVWCIGHGHRHTVNGIGHMEYGIRYVPAICSMSLCLYVFMSLCLYVYGLDVFMFLYVFMLHCLYALCSLHRIASALHQYQHQHQ